MRLLSGMLAILTGLSMGSVAQAQMSANPPDGVEGLYQPVRDQVTETQRQPIPINDLERMRPSIAEHRRAALQ